MAITAKFPGQCKACGGTFPAGAQIEWSKALRAIGVEPPADPPSHAKTAAATAAKMRRRHEGRP